MDLPKEAKENVTYEDFIATFDARGCMLQYHFGTSASRDVEMPSEQRDGFNKLEGCQDGTLWLCTALARLMKLGFEMHVCVHIA